MVRIDVPRVRGKMAEKGYNITSTAKALGVDRNTFSGYLDNPEKIPYGILAKLADLLCSNTEEARSIFLCQ